MKTRTIALLAAVLLCASAAQSQIIKARYRPAREFPNDPDAPHFDLRASLPQPLVSTDTIVIRKNVGKQTIITKRIITDTVYKCQKSHKINTPKKYVVESFEMRFDLGFDNYVGDFLSLNTSKSVYFSAYGATKIGFSRRSPFYFSAGLGLSWNNYRFEDGWTIATADGVTVPSAQYRVDGKSMLEKSKLMTLYAEVPVLLGARIPLGGGPKLFLEAGVIGGVKLGSHAKIKDYEGNKHKEYSSYNLNMLRCAATVRAGIGIVGIFFNRQLTPMFESGHGPKLYPYEIGITF